MVIIYTYRIFTHKTYISAASLDDYPQYYDLTFVFKGEFDYIIDNKEYSVTPGNAIFISPGEHRIRKSFENAEVTYYSINFFSTDDKKIELPHLINNCITPHIRHLLKLIEEINLNLSMDYWDEIFNNTINLLIFLLKNSAKQNFMSPYLKTMLEYISSHYQEHITIEDVAKSVNLTPTYCCHIFKDEFNTTIYDTIMKERILLAKNYILTGEHKLYEIAQLCGFNDYTHFSKYFKKSTGYLPSEYKKEFS